MRWAQKVVVPSSLSAVLIAAAVSVAAAQPSAKDAPAPSPAPAAPATATPAAGTGQEVQMAEDPPPNDMEGTDESPENAVSTEPKVVVAKVVEHTGFPIEAVARPITLPRNMSEVAIELRSTLSPFVSNATLRARYGITRQWQIGLHYNGGGFFEDPVSGKSGYNVGKAAGLDVTYQVQHYVGVTFGVPIYLDPVATAIAVGVPLHFRFGPKYAVGGLDDLLDIRVTKFVPSFYSEEENEVGANNIRTKTITPKGNLRFAGWGMYQHKPNLAFYGRLGVTAVDYSSLNLLYVMRAGLSYSPKRFLDLGASIGFDDLALPGRTFGIEASLAFRI